MHPLDEQHTPVGVLSPREQWLLLCWMVRHPAALAEDTLCPAPCGPGAARRSPLAYVLGLAVGTLLAALVRGRG